MTFQDLMNKYALPIGTEVWQTFPQYDIQKTPKKETVTTAALPYFQTLGSTLTSILTPLMGMASRRVLPTTDIYDLINMNRARNTLRYLAPYAIPLMRTGNISRDISGEAIIPIPQVSPEQRLSTFSKALSTLTTGVLPWEQSAWSDIYNWVLGRSAPTDNWWEHLLKNSGGL